MGQSTWEKSSTHLTNMKIFLFSLLVVASSAQRGAFLKELLNGDLNPCGAGVKPTTCTCADGTTVEPGQGRFQGNGLRGPCGDCSPPATCTCPDGNQQNMPTASDIKERLKSRVLNSPNNPCGAGISVSCSCNDGSTFTPGSIIDNKQCGERPGNPCGSGRPTCRCPDGQSFCPRELRNMLKELAQG